MSYLEMHSAPLPNMTSGIISVWFRDARKNPAPPPVDWPSAPVWQSGTLSMLPPNVITMSQLEENKQNIFFWNSYGRYITGGGITLPIFGPASVMIPNPPPFVANEMHMMLTFGDPNQNYDYYPWVQDEPGVIEGVYYVPAIVTGPQWSVPSFPPPYAPYIHAYGKFKPQILKLASSPGSHPNLVPQSFIGVDKDGYLTICLQTNTRATKANDIYKGYAFQLDKITEITATVSYFKAPPHLVLGTGVWVKVPGYWDGYEFWYTDISNEIMGAQPEYFVIGGPPAAFDFFGIPPVNDGGWHHLLFSFDISGPVQMLQPSVPQGGGRPPPEVTTSCRAWVALDDKNYTGAPLQHRFPIHDGFQMPLLPGMEADITGFGPVTTYVRSSIPGLGPNDILPRSCWITGFRGNPKDGLLQFVSTAGTWNEESTAYIEKGDYNFFVWTANIWPLYHAGDWQGSLDPPRPSSPDPKTFDEATYKCNGFSIPVAGHPIGIPTSTHHIEHNTGLEMAELQIWANRTLNTADQTMRRLFVDEHGKAVSPSKAEKVLGKPDVKLRGSGSWKSGRNSGSSGVDSKGNLLPGGQFRPVGGIEKYVPDPKLNK